MQIKQFIKQLRNTADSLEELFINQRININHNENEVTAKKILRKKKHWTQTAHGRKIMSEIGKNRWKNK